MADSPILATVPLMKRAKEYADKLGVIFSTHFCEQLFEFHETVRTYGVTPVDLMDAEGLLGPNVILAHCVYIAGHSSTTWEYSSDLEKLGRTGSVVAHAPVAYLRRGYNLEGFDRYLAHNVTMCIFVPTQWAALCASDSVAHVDPEQLRVAMWVISPWATTPLRLHNLTTNES